MSGDDQKAVYCHRLVVPSCFSGAKSIKLATTVDLHGESGAVLVGEVLAVLTATPEFPHSLRTIAAIKAPALGLKFGVVRKAELGKCLYFFLSLS